MWARNGKEMKFNYVGRPPLFSYSFFRVAFVTLELKSIEGVTQLNKRWGSLQIA